VHKQLDRMLEVGIIIPMKESNWISLMVGQTKKTCDIRICIDLCGLNASCVHDPFPTPFNDEVLENVGGRETCWVVILFAVKV
jgi:hypothetical protein